MDDCRAPLVHIEAPLSPSVEESRDHIYCKSFAGTLRNDFPNVIIAVASSDEKSQEAYRENRMIE